MPYFVVWFPSTGVKMIDVARFIQQGLSDGQLGY